MAVSRVLMATAGRGSRSNRLGVLGVPKHFGDAGVPLHWDEAWLSPWKHAISLTHVTVPNVLTLGQAVWP